MSSRQEIIDPSTGEVEEVLEQYRPTELNALTTVAAEVNQQIATARAYPRRRDVDIARIISGRATIDEETAGECMYSLPRGKKPIEGPSIRFAEIAQQAWGNNRVSGAVAHIDRENMRIFAEGIYLDLETNAATRVVISRRIASTDKATGRSRIYNDDMIQVTGVAAISIARRNAILAGIPKAVWRGAYNAARQVVMGDMQTLAASRAKAITEFARFGMSADEVFGMLEGVTDENDITLDHLVTLRGAMSGLRNGELTVEEIRREMAAAAKPEEGKPPANVKATLDQFGSGGKADSKENQGATASGGKPAGEPKSEQNGEQSAATAGTSPAGDQKTAETVTVALATKPNTDEPADEAQARAEAIKVAREDGQHAKHEGTRRVAVPGPYRGDKELTDAWLAGWDEAAKGKP